MDYFIFAGNEQKGPYTRAQLDNMWVSGQFTSDAVYWSEGMAEWQPLKALLEEPRAKNGATVLHKKMEEFFSSPAMNVVDDKVTTFQASILSGLGKVMSLPRIIRIFIYLAGFGLLLAVAVYNFVDFRGSPWDTRPPDFSFTAGLDPHDHWILADASRDYAKADSDAAIKTIKERRQIPAPPKNYELELQAQQRWVRYTASDDFNKRKFTKSFDISLAEIFWKKNYTEAYLKPIKELTEANQYYNTSAF